MKHRSPETASVPEFDTTPETGSRIERISGRLRHPFKGGDVSTAEFEAVDPLGGILHPAYREIQEAQANRSFIGRVFDRYRAWRRAGNEPNIRTYETELIVDPEERKQPRRTPQEQERIDRAAAVFRDYDPSKVHKEPLAPLFGSTPPTPDDNS